MHYEVFGSGPTTVFLLPTWSIIHSHFWKAQVHHLARHFRVLTYDGRGNGRSDRPEAPEAYRDEEFVADALAVMDATGTERAILIGLSMGALRALYLAADFPERVQAVVFIGSAVNLAPGHPERLLYPFDQKLDTVEGWAKFNAHYWRQDFRGFLEFFFSQACSEPYSTKVIEDCVGWGLETDAETLLATRGGGGGSPEELLELCARVQCPTLILHGDHDAIRPHANGVALARATGGQLVTLAGSGHLPQSRDPVKVNLLVREFVEKVCPPPAAGERRWTRSASRKRRALFVSSPIGLGHAQRDAAIARELRRLVPELEIDWLAQDPVTRVLAAEGERVHPASIWLASESRHIELEAAGHDLHVFQALRRMDEIFIANFMVFHDVVQAEPYDLWIGDEAWELDHFLHENPELKTAPYVWLSDFVGYLPMPDGGEREAFLTADYNAEMLRHLARFPQVRDRSIFVGNLDDIVP
ncbi:alpha/beta fold hydrolase [Deinococcus sp. QL22]|uniref:alpha/beta fold hydrolase n=1 Tax=Deinococcus sp. QL22 TaxID=2939437 RepID=UPI002017591F|nr:alpha/beta hydrolase [Deinococcus sp. QL22]UQN08490.1 alpha/beta hydrolase [Deinococcus sp. QL22]